MFNSQPEKQSKLDATIENVHDELTTLDVNSEAYSAGVDQLIKLYSIQNSQKPDRVSKDTLAIIAGNLAGIAMIAGYERTHIITTKAIAFIRQLH